MEKKAVFVNRQTSNIFSFTFSENEIRIVLIGKTGVGK